MTTSRSPLRALKAQADLVAKALKAAERGENPVGESPFGGKLADARATPSVTFGVAMDDKFLKIEMTWATIKTTSEAGIAEYVLKQMRGARDTVQ